MIKKLIFISLLLLSCKLYSLEMKDFEGCWISENDINFIISSLENMTISTYSGYKRIRNTTINILAVKKDETLGSISIDGLSTWAIVNATVNNNCIQLTCSRIEYEYSESKNMMLPYVGTDQQIIQIVLLGDDIIRIDYIERLFYKGANIWHRISGPAKIPVKEGTINDTRVRLRTKPNLSSETWGFFSTGDKVKVKDKSAEKYEIDGESWYWYKVDHPNYPDGWVYGKYVDIVE